MGVIGLMVVVVCGGSSSSGSSSITSRLIILMSSDCDYNGSGMGGRSSGGSGRTTS